MYFLLYRIFHLEEKKKCYIFIIYFCIDFTIYIY